jgi:CDP-diacylglycerol--serine O-phosphatidyltransferase
MLGFWNKSVYITYFGAFVAVFGLLYAISEGNIDYAFVGMIIAAVCDMFDGKVARHEKDRTEQQKDFGVEIDSLADIVCFIVIPTLTIHQMMSGELLIDGTTSLVCHWWQVLILALYVVCGIVRLAYFNVAMSDKNKAIEYYTGLPVPMSVPLFALVWLIAKVFNLGIDTRALIYTIVVPIVGYLHISKIRIKKYTNIWFYIAMCIISAIGIALFVLL